MRLIYSGLLLPQISSFIQKYQSVYSIGNNIFSNHPVGPITSSHYLCHDQRTKEGFSYMTSAKGKSQLQQLPSSHRGSLPRTRQAHRGHSISLIPRLAQLRFQIRSLLRDLRDYEIARLRELERREETREYTDSISLLLRRSRAAYMRSRARAGRSLANTRRKRSCRGKHATKISIT